MEEFGGILKLGVIPETRIALSGTTLCYRSVKKKLYNILKEVPALTSFGRDDEGVLFGRPE